MRLPCGVRGDDRIKMAEAASADRGERHDVRVIVAPHLRGVALRSLQWRQP